MKTKALTAFIILALGYFIGRSQAPVNPQTTDLAPVSVKKDIGRPEQMPESNKQPEYIRKRKTVAEVYKPKKVHKYSKEKVSSRIKQLKKFDHSEFQNENDF